MSLIYQGNPTTAAIQKGATGAQNALVIPYENSDNPAAYLEDVPNLRLIRINSDTNIPQYWNGTQWVVVGSNTGASVNFKIGDPDTPANGSTAYTLPDEFEGQAIEIFSSDLGRFLIAGEDYSRSPTVTGLELTLLNGNQFLNGGYWNISGGKAIDGAQEVLDEAKAYTDERFNSLAGGQLPASPTDEPTTGVYIYNVKEAGTYTNFGGLVVTTEDLEEGQVQLWLTDGVWSKEIIPINLSAYLSKSEAESEYVSKGGFTDTLNNEVTRTPAFVPKVFGAELTGGVGATAITLASRIHWTEPSHISDKDGKILSVTVNVGVAGNMVFATGKSNVGGFTIRSTSPSIPVIVGYNTIDLSSYNLQIVSGEVLGVYGVGSTAQLIYKSDSLRPTLKFAYQNVSGTKTLSGGGNFFDFKYTMEYSDRSELYEIFTTKEELNVKSDEIIALQQQYNQKISITTDVASQVLNGATRSGNTITIPSGQTGLNSYMNYLLPSGLQGGLVGYTVIAEIFVKATVNLPLSVLRGYFTGGVVGTETETLQSTDGTYNWYIFRIQISLSGATAALNTAIQTSNNTPLASTGTFEILERNIYLVSTSSKTLAPLQSYATDRKIDASISTALTAAQSGTRKVLRVKKNGTVGVDCEFNGNRGIQNAIESISDASLSNQYDVLVFPGIYEASVLADYNSNGITTGMVSFIRGKNFVNIRGTDKIRCIIKGELPDNLTGSIYQNVQTMYWHANFGNVENFIITAKNMRYPLHIDNGQTGNKDFYSKFRNVDIVHLGNFGNATAWPSVSALGLGSSDGQKLDFESVRFKSPFTAGYLHNNQLFGKENILNFNYCSFDNSGNGWVFRAQSLGSKRNDIININGSSFDSGQIIIMDDNPWIPTALVDQEYNHNEIKFKGCGNSPFLVINNTKGFALKITSKGTGATSVRFNTGTAFDAIIKDKDYSGATFTTEDGEINADGYAYRDGNGTIKGYALGRLDIGGEAYGLSLNTYGKSLGKRLGDCSTVNKVLTVIIDGTTYNSVLLTGKVFYCCGFR